MMKENLVTEPTVCNELTIPQLDNIVNGTENLVDLCNLKDVYCHTQVNYLWFFFLYFYLHTRTLFNNCVGRNFIGTQKFIVKLPDF